MAVTAPLPTSGTVSQYIFDQSNVIDHAFRRAGLAAEMESGENIIIAQGLIYTILSEWINVGFPLWTRQYLILGAPLAGTNVPTPLGTAEVIHVYWRSLNPYRGPATTTGAADASVLFAGQPNTDITIAGPNPGVTVAFGTSTGLYTVGVLLGGASPVIAALQIATSQDGVTYSTAYTLPSATYAPGVWTYFDIDPIVTAPFMKLLMPGAGSWTVNQINFGLANASDIELGILNIDDYYNLPNKPELADRAVSCFVDRQLNFPVIKIWGTLNVGGFYNGVIVALVRRYIQDPGSMTQAVEVPQRALEALIWRLATMLIWEIPESTTAGPPNPFSLQAKQQRTTNLEAKATKAEQMFWSEERNKSPIRIAPNISPYTR